MKIKKMNHRRLNLPPRINMKTARFLFTVMAFGSLTLGLGYAGELSSPSSKRETRENAIASNRSGAPAHAKTDRTEGKPSKHEEDGHPGLVKPQVKRASEKEPHQLELKKAATAATEATMKKKAENQHEQPGKLVIAREATASTPGAIRGRSATSTVIGKVRMSGALDGATVIRRKP
jgi:hypothetical protein